VLWGGHGLWDAAVAQVKEQTAEAEDPAPALVEWSWARVWAQCNTGATLSSIPTKRRRHAITETPRVQTALDELRKELGSDSVELGELVVLGVGVKLDEIRSERDRDAAKRRRLADRVRSRLTGADVDAADEVRLTGWARS
jgi:hypothetical protein